MRRCYLLFICSALFLVCSCTQSRKDMILGEWKGVRAEYKVAPVQQPGMNTVPGSVAEGEAIMAIISEAVRGTGFEFKSDETWTSVYENSEGKAPGKGTFAVDPEVSYVLLNTDEGPHAGESQRFEVTLLTNDTLKIADDNNTVYVYAR